MKVIWKLDRLNRSILLERETAKQRELTIDEIREAFQIQKGKYTKYNDFKRFVILSSQKELKEKTDICFEFTELKEGRKVAAIHFQILKNKNFAPPKKKKTTQTVNSQQAVMFEDNEAQSPNQQDIQPKNADGTEPLRQMAQIGISKKSTQSLWKHALKTVQQPNISQYFLKKIQLLQTQNQKNPIQNPAGFLRKAIDENYKDEAREKEERQKQQRKFHNKRIETLEKLQKQKNQLEKERDKVLQEITSVVLQHKPEEKIKAIEQYRMECQEKRENNKMVVFPYKEELTPEENYSANLMIQWHCYKHISPQFPKQFEPVEKNFQAQIQKIAEQIAKTKAMQWQPNNISL